MGRDPADQIEMPETEVAGQMPKSTRGAKGRTPAIQTLVERIEDGEVHRLTNVSEENKDKWGRKIRYAARLAGESVTITWCPPDNEQGQEPGLYFQKK